MNLLTKEYIGEKLFVMKWLIGIAALALVFGLYLDSPPVIAQSIVPTPTPTPILPTPTPTPLMPPSADAGGPYLVAINSTLSLDGSGTDPDGGVFYKWSSDEPGSVFSDDTVEDPNYTAGSAAGVFELSLTVTDFGNLSDTDLAMLVVYDPDDGFVTGGGWIDSPSGAYIANPSLTGKATFGFVSKYKKGANVPTGNTEFQFKAGNLDFHSDKYDWLVVNQGGSNAQFKGEGTINGGLAPNDELLKFMIWAGDGDPDTLHIKIWWEEADGTEHDVYDNGTDQPIGGGSIVIHTGKRK